MRYFKILTRKGCPYCVHAKELLIEKKEQFMFCCLDDSDILLSFFKKKYDWNTVPMIIERYTDSNREKFVGGFTDLCTHLESEKK